MITIENIDSQYFIVLTISKRRFVGDKGYVHEQRAKGVAEKLAEDTGYALSV